MERKLTPRHRPLSLSLAPEEDKKTLFLNQRERRSLQRISIFKSPNLCHYQNAAATLLRA
jgi:hypothetical protein